MKIRNINVTDNLIKKISDLDILQFILEVIRPLEKEYYSKCDIELYCRHPEKPEEETASGSKEDRAKKILSKDIRTISLCGYENIATYVHTIPIFFKEKGKLSKKDYRYENAIVEEFGAYSQKFGQYSGYIDLYVDRIYELANKDDKKFKWLFTKTLIHELAHAVLDILNLEITTPYVNKISYNTDFGRWREESMANAIALRIIKDFGDKDFYNYAKLFMMRQQPKEYALGVLMEDFDYWDMRSVIMNKYEGVSQDLQDEWMKYVQGRPDCEGLKQWNKKLLGLE